MNEIVEFDAVGTIDSDGSIVAVEWDFGDGARASGFSARHAYRTPGQYKVHVLSRDNSGRRGSTSEATFTVNVTYPFNQPPQGEVVAELRMKAASRTSSTRALRSIPTDRSPAIAGISAMAPEPMNLSLPRLCDARYLFRFTDAGRQFRPENGTTIKQFVALVEERHNVQPMAEAGNESGPSSASASTSTAAARPTAMAA